VRNAVFYFRKFCFDDGFGFHFRYFNLTQIIRRQKSVNRKTERRFAPTDWHPADNFTRLRYSLELK